LIVFVDEEVFAGHRTARRERREVSTGAGYRPPHHQRRDDHRPVGVAQRDENLIYSTGDEPARRRADLRLPVLGEHLADTGPERRHRPPAAGAAIHPLHHQFFPQRACAAFRACTERGFAGVIRIPTEPSSSSSSTSRDNFPMSDPIKLWC
jgi:hypothetical protein